MKSKLIANTLGLLTMAVISFATPAHANDWQDDDDRNDRYSERDEARDATLIQMWREGFRLSKLVNDRQDQQLDRILASVEADRLSKAKFIKLMQEQNSIRSMESRFMDDQVLSEREFQRLNQSLDVAQRNIQVARSNHERAQYSYSQRSWSPN